MLLASQHENMPGIGFNPFLVRASVYCPCNPAGKCSCCLYGFNPFLVRASVYCLLIAFPSPTVDRVSIPS